MRVEAILDVRNLVVEFDTEEGIVKALNGVSFCLKKGEILGIVGETGCGKSVTVYTVLKLLPMPPARIVSGEVIYKGRDLLKLSEEELRKIRGKEIAMIFQEPMTSLNPVFTVGKQLMDVIFLHRKVSKEEAREIALKALEDVRMQDPELIMKKYPHELSGGMRQRVMIAMALSCNPEILIADEPTTALDVTIQAQILAIIKEMQSKHNMSVIFITHDLGVVAQLCDRVVVMYAGTVVEMASIDTIFKNPVHPYTRGLLESIPKIDKKQEKLRSIPGIVPNLVSPPPGCRYHPRCERFLKNLCDREAPKLLEIEKDHFVACHNPYKR
ncbi:MAG: peptide ABC transporter ATP-binding protein [Thermotoga sp. 4484_232]|nr:ABC transporter ATP-binding protein [Thermotogaceae bacterium]OQX58576.1 MAG: peptide ABC transporter ATP-binding protein [Thermotoga sp. 4484_232]RKX40505.1 MAG: ABC transporter ATP-binding protein [Thermotogota bacterium]RKX53376.1 MAG: ABC transporter ATP-binding protein [Thermotoga sp.]RKX57285.1 MAG: ABC transporter ATP-binding protein [Thermotoga sp.]